MIVLEQDNKRNNCQSNGDNTQFSLLYDLLPFGRPDHFYLIIRKATGDIVAHLDKVHYSSDFCILCLPAAWKLTRT